MAERRSQKNPPYRLASAAEKQRISQDRIREPAISCPHCETKTSVSDLLAHIDERCPGHKPVHRLSRWVTWREAQECGARKQSLWRWVKLGLVRVRGPKRSREYLLRDIVRLLAANRPPGGSASK